MRNGLTGAIILVILVGLLSGCGAAKKETTKQVQAPSATTPSSSAASASPAGASLSLPGNQAALKAAQSRPSTIAFQVMTVDNAGGKDKSDYLDQAIAPKNWPEKNMLVLMVFTGENYDIRFAMGADFNQKISVDQMLALVRSKYLPKARENDPAGGLADLIDAVNERMAAK